MTNIARAQRPHRLCSADELFGILRGKLHSHRCPHLVPAKPLQIVIEVTKGGSQHQRLDTSHDRALGQRVSRMLSSGIVIARNVEAAQRWRDSQRGQVTR